MKETTLTGWAIGLQPLPENETGLTHRLVLVDGRAGANGQLVPGAEAGETISVLLDADAVRVLRDRFEQAARDVGPVRIAQALPPGRAERRAFRHA